MAYNITKSDGLPLVTVSDGTRDDTSTSLVLVGKNFSGYGEFINENLVHMLENFANNAAPRSPQIGQLWWDSSAGALKVKSSPGPDGWKQLSAAIPSASQPINAIEGDMWWDTTNKQLKVYNGSAYTLIGPAYSTTAGTSGAIVETVVDSASPPGSHIVVKIYTSGKVVATLSQDAEFTPNPPILGFTTIKPGITLASTSTIPNAKFYGTADDASSLGGAAAANYARTDIATTFANSVTISSNNGLTIGSSNSFTQTVSSGNVSLTNRTINANITIAANVGGTITNAIQVLGSTGTVSVANLSATGSTFLSGNVTITGNAIPGANTTYNLGSSTARFSNIFASVVNAVSTSAQYADLAERFESDQAYPAGTVVAIGGTKEVTAALTDLTEDVFGVVSTQAAYLMNAGAGSDATHPAIAVNGRVPVRVIGRINKGDRLVAAGNGLARAGNRNEISSFNVIGRALESKTTDGEGTILAIVKLNS